MQNNKSNIRDNNQAEKSFSKPNKERGYNKKLINRIKREEN